MTVWVEGATGIAGRRVTAALAAAGVPVRAASRRPGPPSPGVTPVLFDWYDRSTWASAVGEADAIFLKGLNKESNAAEIVTGFLAAAPTVRHVVLMTTVGMERAPDDQPRRALELAVQNSGKQWTILRPNIFLQNFDEFSVYSTALRERNELWAASGGGRVSFCDTRDIADAAVVVLTEDGHHERSYALTGPESVSYAEVAQALTRASGRPIRHIDPAPDEERKFFADTADPEWDREAWADVFAELWAMVRAGAFATVFDDFHRLTGNPPRTLAAYAEEAWSESW